MSDTTHRLGIVTGSAPELTEDGRALADALRDSGNTVEPVVWDDPGAGADPSALDGLVIRSCWDYHERPAAFREWLAAAERTSTVFNDPELVRWNVHKFYLRELREAGVDVLPTAFLESGGDAALGVVLEERGWTDAVVKPAVGTSSRGVWRCSGPPGPDERERFDAALGRTDLLVQAFAPEVHDGELSMVFLGGTFSHANRSVPADDDFRNHPDYGNSLEPAAPARDVVAQSRAALTAAAEATDRRPDEITYARVDGIVRGGSFRLMELELVEPYLDLARHGGAAEQLAEAVVAGLGAD